MPKGGWAICVEYRPMDRISAWIDEKPYRFQLILFGHTAVFTCAILIAAARF